MSGPQTGTLRKQGTKIATKPTKSMAGMSNSTAIPVNNFMPTSARLNDVFEEVLGETSGAIASSIMVSLDLPTVLRLRERSSK